MTDYVGHRESKREWWDRAACSGKNPEWWDSDFFVQDKLMTLDNIAAIHTCLTCPVRWECLADAIDNRGEFTIRGGYLPSEQKQLIEHGNVRSRTVAILEKLMEYTDDRTQIVKQAHQVLTNRGRMPR